MRTIGVVSVARSDYGILSPILRRIRQDPELKLHLIVGGMHLSREFGLTVREIERDGFPIAERVEALSSSDSPAGIAGAMGRGLTGFAQAFSRFRPDLFVAAGDRFETAAAVLAALPFKIPVAHLHGGEITQGAFDDALRHAMTKLSHLHFVATEEYARRVIRMGEEPWRVLVSGAPALDNLRAIRLLSREQLQEKIGLGFKRAPLLVTFHPVTLEYEQAERQAEDLLEALRLSDFPIVFTRPNADTNGRVITRGIQSFLQRHPQARLVDSLGTEAYFSLMAVAAAMVGNSSSGLVEAPSFLLPVVNIGTRQAGRVRARNVIDVGYGQQEIADGIKEAVSPEFRAGLQGLVNPYGDGTAAERIVRRLKEVALDERLIVKCFQDEQNSLVIPAKAGIWTGIRSSRSRG